jgi:hypothetical protein
MFDIVEVQIKKIKIKNKKPVKLPPGPWKTNQSE